MRWFGGGVGGVVVGRVSAIELDPERLVPVVSLSMDKQYKYFPETSSLSILTSGLLGEQFLGLSPGFMDDDIEMLTKLAEDETRICTYVDFDRVASLLREISQVNNPI